MGTKVAPTYASLLLRILEEKCILNGEKIDTHFSNYIKHQWKRYLDDCFFFWEKSDKRTQGLSFVT
jgi:hypothetical protein